MSDPYLTQEASISDSRPSEFYELVQSNTVTYRIASGTRDIVDGGNTYTATPSARTDLTLSTTTGDVSLTLSLPLSHALSQRWTALGSPPRKVRVTIRRLQPGVGVEQFFVGDIASFAFERHIAKFQLISNMQRQLDRTIGKVISVHCVHWLYDRACRIDPNAFRVDTTITGFDGTLVTVATVAPVSSPIASDVFPGGEFVHHASGETQTIATQSGTILHLQMPLPGLVVGDSVTLYRGCDHTVGTCGTVFSNVLNFLGAPELPNHELFIPGYRLGVLAFP